MRTVIIVQARMTSTRLPGKVMKTVLGKPLLEFQIERLRRVMLMDEVVIATTTNHTDDQIVAFCDSHAVPCYRGSEEDVLARYYGAAVANGAETILRVTSDCPLIDPDVINSMIEVYRRKVDDIDYLSNTLMRTFPRGLDCEIFSFDLLEQAFRQATSEPEREHVTPYLYNHPEIYRLESFEGSSDYSDYRWTVDTPEDFELIRRMLEALYPTTPRFTLDDCLALLKRNPDWKYLNSGVMQKVLGQ